MAPAAMGRKRAPPGAGRDVLQPESHVAHGNRARRSGCEDKFLGFDAESPRVRKSKDGCAHSRRLQNCRTVETARAPVIERGADARGSGSREKRGGADSRHGVDGPRTHDARERRRAHGATRRATPPMWRAQTGSELADVRGWGGARGRLLAHRDRVFFVV